MSKLIQIYSNACGLKIDAPFIQEEFFPLKETTYMTIQGGSGQQSKVYDYFSEVIDLLEPLFKANNITIIQLGGKDDGPIRGCKHLMGQTNFGQVANILRNSILHIGLDSWITHLAGAMQKPLVSLYGSTSVQNHGPYWKSDRTILIESHRNGNIPSYGQEQEKTVNLIAPEEVANSVLTLCGISQRVNQKTIYIGGRYNNMILEYVPNFPLGNSLPNTMLIARMDYHFDENNVFTALSQGRKMSLVTNRELNIDILSQLKTNVLGISYEITPDTNPSYIVNLKKTGIKLKIYTKQSDPVILTELKLKFFDICLIEKLDVLTKENALQEFSRYSNKKIDSFENSNKILYRSTKFMISNGNIYPSKAAWEQNLPTSSFDQNVGVAIDSPAFWEEFTHFRIFEVL
jgi:hypothetical protein